MTSRFVAIVTLLLGLAAGTAQADQNAKNLGPLFKELYAAKHPITASQLEREIWRTWQDSGDKEVNKELQAGIGAMSDGEYEESIDRFSKVIEMDPDFAEGWNKRATAYYLNGELAKSMQDIQKTLSLEPRHFGAISGMGLIFLQEGDERAALKAFEEVLKIYPMAPTASMQVERLKKKLDGPGV
ncbi:MAG: tetratricopeptide repeat protein [Arenicellales bacterium]